MREVSTIAAPVLWVEQIRKAVAEAFEARRARAELAVLSERELQDIGWARRDEASAAPAENAQERAARALAVRAWYGHDKKAA